MAGVAIACQMADVSLGLLLVGFISVLGTTGVSALLVRIDV